MVPLELHLAVITNQDDPSPPSFRLYVVWPRNFPGL